MKLTQKLTAGAALVAAAGSSFAVGPSAGDLANLTPDMATVLTAVGAVAVVLIGVNLAIKGFRIVSALIGKR